MKAKRNRSMSGEELNSILSGLDFLADVPLTFSVEFGNAEVLADEVMGYRKGSVIELDKMAGEPCDILLNNRLFARGEVVVFNDKFAVRLIDIIGGGRHDAK